MKVLKFWLSLFFKLFITYDRLLENKPIRKTNQAYHSFLSIFLSENTLFGTKSLKLFDSIHFTNVDSCPKVFRAKAVLKNSAKFTWKYPCKSHFFSKFVGHVEFGKFSRTHSYRTPLTSASFSILKIFKISLEDPEKGYENPCHLLWVVLS